MPRISETFEPSGSKLIDNCQIKLTEPENNLSLPSTYLHNTKVSTAKSSLHKNHKASSFVTQLPDPTPQTFF